MIKERSLSPTNADSPWYRHGWPWLLMLVPFAAVLFGIVMIATATLYPDDVVVDTYYRDGQAINQLRALDDVAQQLGVSARLQLGDERSVLVLTGTQESALRLFLYHVTDSSADREIAFSPGIEGEFISTDGSLSGLLGNRGVWYVELRGADNDWRLRKRVETPLTVLEF